MIRSESFTIFFVSELESSTILNLITFLLIISDLLEETILLESLFFLIALAIEDPIKPHPTMHTFLNIILNPNQFFLLR